MILWYALSHIFTLFRCFHNDATTFISEWLNKTHILYTYGVATGDSDMTVMMECMSILYITK